MSEPSPNLDRDVPSSDFARRHTARLNLRAIITGALSIAIIGAGDQVSCTPEPSLVQGGKYPDRHRSRVSGRLAKVPVAPSGCGGGRDPTVRISQIVQRPTPVA